MSKNNIFEYLDWILKSSNKEPETHLVSTYMCNRWLSMASKPIAQIVNATNNRWNSMDSKVTSKIYRCIIPKYAKKIEYIKKPVLETHDTDEFDENINLLSNSMELSKKEIELYVHTLEQLNIASK
jgi:hypothetical protein